jgi:hypothetical protein
VSLMGQIRFDRSGIYRFSNIFHVFCHCAQQLHETRMIRVHRIRAEMTLEVKLFLIAVHLLQKFEFNFVKLIFSHESVRKSRRQEVHLLAYNMILLS